MSLTMAKFGWLVSAPVSRTVTTVRVSRSRIEVFPASLCAAHIMVPWAFIIMSEENISPSPVIWWTTFWALTSMMSSVAERM